MTRRLSSLVILCILVGLTAIWVHRKPSDVHPLPTAMPKLPAHIVLDSANAPTQKSSHIEAVFVLDTTGSMSGLLEGAKDTIWSIANRLADGDPKPSLKVGLVAFRDRGDDYVTQVTPLSTDIDSVYDHLKSLNAAGGGDTPESVHEALYEALNTMRWSQDDNVYRVVFLVGDAPPQKYLQTPSAETLGQLAKAKGIRINAIQCGALPGTDTAFAKLAVVAGGQFASIAQDGAVQIVATPMDKALAELNLQLAQTAIVYGEEQEQNRLRRKIANVRSAPAHRITSRGSYMSKTGSALVTGKSDLVDAVTLGAVDVSKIPAAHLPKEMQALAVKERLAYVSKRESQRKEINSQIAELSAKRDAYLKKERERLARDGKGNSYDENIMTTIREQAAAKGIVYK